MKLTSIVILLIGIILTDGPAQMKFVEKDEQGTLTLRDGKIDVLTYRFGYQLKTGVDPRYTRSCYIHPLFSLDGQVLTDDFPKDHLHHPWCILDLAYRQDTRLGHADLAP